uniref:Uncharacterized protein n=1 Tax=Anguilla anguilla TaxID=7936 RepID=A0A0E9Q543_ANGAN
MTRRRGLHFLRVFPLVPMHQTRSVKRRKVFDSKTNAYLTQV